MPQRGTMGIRATRLRIDGLLNNTPYWIAYPSSNVRYTDATDRSVLGTVETIYATKQAPANLLNGSKITLYWYMRSESSTYRVYTKAKLNGVDVPGSSFSSNSTTFDPTWITFTMQGGDNISVYMWTNSATGTGHVKDMQVRCDYGGIIPAIGPASW